MSQVPEIPCVPHDVPSLSSFVDLRSSICQLGSAAVKHGRALTLLPTQKRAADWIVSHELGEYNDCNQLVVQSIACNFETSLSAARRLREPEALTERSLWSLRRKLQVSGWRLGGKGQRLSIAKKVISDSNRAPSYYAILLE